MNNGTQKKKHSDRLLIEQGEDNKGKFYKVYYKEEQ